MGRTIPTHCNDLRLSSCRRCARSQVAAGRGALPEPLSPIPPPGSWDIGKRRTRTTSGRAWRRRASLPGRIASCPPRLDCDGFVGSCPVDRVDGSGDVPRGWLVGVTRRRGGASPCARAHVVQPCAFADGDEWTAPRAARRPSTAAPGRPDAVLDGCAARRWAASREASRRRAGEDGHALHSQPRCRRAGRSPEVPLAVDHRTGACPRHCGGATVRRGAHSQLCECAHVRAGSV